MKKIKAGNDKDFIQNDLEDYILIQKFLEKIIPREELYKIDFLDELNLKMDEKKDKNFKK